MNELADGDLMFGRGMDSSTNPFLLQEGAYQEAMNLVNRGGILQTRPGYQQLFELPPGNLQGITVFKPRLYLPMIIAVVDGWIFRSEYPYRTYSLLTETVRLSPDVDNVFFVSAVKSVERNDDLSLRFIQPRNVLVIQDGVSAPVSWDGTEVKFNSGAGSVPQGTVMAWSGDRLWVARNERLYASDIADPLSFLEQTYNTLGGTQYFLLPDLITAIAETPGVETAQLLVFTRKTTTVFASSVRVRSQWPNVQDFQHTIFPKIGCVAHRSIVEQHGLLWWFAEFGLTNFNAALMAKQSSRLGYTDNEMAVSKGRLSGDLSGVAGAVFENYLLMSVPYTDQFNRHTWAIDGTVFGNLQTPGYSAWNSYWTGTRPVQWATLDVLGKPRIIHASKDRDGRNVVWEAFVGRRDNGCDITWGFTSRAYSAGSSAPKELRFAELHCAELAGEDDVQIRWAGAFQGKFKVVQTKRIVATEGTVYADQEIGDEDDIFALKKQSRVIRTIDLKDQPEGADSVAGVERQNVDKFPTERVDAGFQISVIGSGQCAVAGLRVFMDAVVEHPYGKCEPTETGINAVRFDGAASRSVDGLLTSPNTFTVAVTASHGEITKTASATSVISALDAEKLARQIAEARVSWEFERVSPMFPSTPVDPTDPDPTDPDPDPDPDPGEEVIEDWLLTEDVFGLTDELGNPLTF